MEFPPLLLKQVELSDRAWPRIRWLLTVVVFSLLLSACADDHVAVLRTDTFRVSISETGQIVRMQDWSNGTEYVSRPSPLLQLRQQGVFLLPIKAAASGDGVDLWYAKGFKAHVTMTEKSTHLVFELTHLSNPDSVDLVLWGPFATTINESIGETVGIARGGEFAIGMQALNIRTLGGYPWNENDAMPQMDIFEGDNFHDMDPSKSRSVLFRVEAAKPDSMGSTFQAYTRNRRVDRVIPNRGYERYVAPAYEDGGVVGSKIAFFGVPTQQTLATLGIIEVEEGLPHPMIDGVWGKESPSANAAYIIMNFSEETAEQAMDITQQAGLKYLYHDGPFETWGHFSLNSESFPDGIASLKRITDRASERGIMVGTHNLSNFISTNDPYVTPVPDARLAKVGSTTVLSALSNSDPVVLIDDPSYFNQSQTSYLMAAQVGVEIITYSSVSASEPWQLTGVVRGAFGTKAGPHAPGSVISKLDDHGYKVFLSETELSIEMASTLATIYNEAGLRQISFDGLEGNRSTGMGNYGESLFAQTWFDNLNDDIRSHYIADASRTTHFFWHMYTRMNWGEPWYAGFRESQTEYRLKNQAYFERNLMPGMLGWFKMTPQTSVEDIEWMLSLSAGYDAGYGFVTSFDAVEGNGKAETILGLLGDWEKLRISDAFSPEQKARLRSRDLEYHLEVDSLSGWTLTPISVHIFRHVNRDKQPGEPEESIFELETSHSNPSVHFVLTAEGGTASGVELILDNKPAIQLDLTLGEGESFVYRGSGVGIHYDSSWHVKRQIDIDPSMLEAAVGKHTVSLRSAFEGDEKTALRLEVRVPGIPESGIRQ